MNKETISWSWKDHGLAYKNKHPLFDAIEVDRISPMRGENKIVVRRKEDGRVFIGQLWIAGWSEGYGPNWDNIASLGDDTMVTLHTGTRKTIYI